LPKCPNCGTSVASPTKVFTVIIEPKEGEHGLTQRKVGMYACEKCGTKFPVVVSRQHYLIVAEDQLVQIQTDVKNLKKTNHDLEKRIALMDESLEKTKKDSESKVLETKLEALERHVAYLRKEKGELEEKATKLR